jgi:hypothetical protein
MGKCAFCPRTAKLSGEHLWSEWMGSLFRGTRFRFRQRDVQGNIIGTWPSLEIDLKAKVVCKPCNEGWMSNLEDRHARPALADLIVGRGVDLIVSQSRANAIALFAFKTAVIVDHMRRDTPFFRRSVRYHFAESLEMPSNVQMWFAEYLPVSSGRFTSYYHQHSTGAANRFKLYVCTYAVGHFVFQVVAARSVGQVAFVPAGGDFEYLAVPFWPSIPIGFVWPPVYSLRNTFDFNAFAKRWFAVRFVRA